MTQEEYKANIAYLEENDIMLIAEGIWDEQPQSVELETYTNDGEDMIIDLEEPSKAELQKYIDDFDENENVLMWWRDGEDAAHEHGVPFTDIRDHYNDYEEYISQLQEVCDGMPY